MEDGYASVGDTDGAAGGGVGGKKGGACIFTGGTGRVQWGAGVYRGRYTSAARLFTNVYLLDPMFSVIEGCIFFLFCWGF